MPYQPYQSTWNNPYVTSNPYGASPVMPTVQPYQQPVNGIIKVNGRDSAAQYQLPPNSMSPALFDQNGKTFYIVSTDGTGAKTVEAFDFTPHVDEHLEAIRILYPKSYDSLMDKIRALR